MILSDSEIVDALATRHIIVTPAWEPGDIRPAGLRLHLGSELLLPVEDGRVRTLLEPESSSFDQITIDRRSGFDLKPGQLVLGATRERVFIGSRLVGILDGRSTAARIGLLIHCSSAIIDNNHEEGRAIVLELYNCGRNVIRLYPGDPIGMLVFARLGSDVGQSASGQYSGQCGTTPPVGNLQLSAKGDY